LLQIGPELFLAQITARPKGQPQDRNFLGKSFPPQGVISAEARIFNATGDQLKPLQFWPLPQGPGQLKHIAALAASICISAQLKVVAPE